MRSVPAMDASGLHAFEVAIEKLRRDGIEIFLTAVRPQPMKVMFESGLVTGSASKILRRYRRGACGCARRPGETEINRLNRGRGISAQRREAVAPYRPTKVPSSTR